MNDDDDTPIINLTPLIDVVFVVLITFMIIAPVLEIDQVHLASGSGKEQASSTTLSIAVHSDNSLWVEGKPIALSELKQWAKKEHTRAPSIIPKVIHDKRAQFGTYQAIKNILEEVGFEEMDIVLQP